MQKNSNLRQVGPPIQHNGIAIRVEHDAEGKRPMMPMFLFTLTGKTPVHALLAIEEAEQFHRELGRAIDSVRPENPGDDIPW